MTPILHRPWLAVLLAVLSLAAPAPAQNADPIEEFRQALLDRRNIPDPDETERKQERDERLKAHADRLKRLTDRLRTVREMARVLMLPEWHDLLRERDTDLVNLETNAFDRLGDRFLEEFDKRVKSDSRAQQAAAATLTAEMVGAPVLTPTGGFEASGNLQRTFVLRKMLPRLKPLARSDDPLVGEAVSRAVGRVFVSTKQERKDADVAVMRSILQPLAESKSPQVRRAVAEARGYKLLLISENERVPRSVNPTDKRDIEEMLDFIAPGSFRGLTDTDPQVRQQDLDTLRRIVQVLEKRYKAEPAPRATADPQKPPPPPRPDEILSLRRALQQEVAQLRPKLDLFTLGERSFRSILRSNNPEERLGALRLLEDIAILRGRLNDLMSDAPPVPPRRTDVALPTPGTDATPVKVDKPDKADKGDKPDKGDKADKPEPPRSGLDTLFRQLQDDLLQRFNDRSPDVRLEAVLVVDGLGTAGRFAGPALVDRLSDPDRFVRWVAARALGKLGGKPLPGEIEGLARMVKDSDLDARRAALTALNLFGPEAAAAVPALKEMVDRGDVESRVPVIQALGSIGRDGKQVVPLLARALEHRDVRVRRAAALAIIRFGADAALARAALGAALDDEDLELRRYAADALLNIPER